MINARGGIGKAGNGKMNPAVERRTAWSGANGGFCLGFNWVGLEAGGWSGGIPLSLCGFSPQ